MRLWIDECLSPTLVAQAQALGYQATCNRDRGRLGAHDPELFSSVADEDFVFVTNNEADFVKLCGTVDLHAGLVVIPQCPRDRQQRLLSTALGYIGEAAGAEGVAPRDWMVNRAVEVDEDTETCAAYPLPASA